MRKGVYLILVIIIITFLSYLFWKEKTAIQSREHLNSKISEDERKAKEDHLDHFIEQMSISEKIGQLIFSGIKGTTMTEEIKRLINDYKVGGIILFAKNLDEPMQSVQLLNQLKNENNQNELPLFLGVDQEGGRVERLPHLIKLPTNLEIGTKNNEQFSYEMGALLGRQLNAFGFNLNFAPVLDVNSNPDNPVIGDRSFGNEPEVVSNLGVQTMLGMQSQRIIPVVKHFPGHGDTSVDSHLELPLVNKNLKELHELELIPFQKSVEAGADMVMTAHILLPQIDSEFPASMSKKVINDILRDKLAFNGVIITDDMTMRAITNHFEIGEAAVQSVKAGTDIILLAHHHQNLVSVYNALLAAVETGEITEERINQSLRRIIQLKRKYEIVDEQVEDIDIQALNELIEKHLHQ